MCIDTVFKVADLALEKKPSNVKIIWEAVDRQIEKMRKDGKPEFFVDQKEDEIPQEEFILKELIACSINYCYWYGVHDIRPNDASSTSMYNLVEYIFRECHCDYTTYVIDYGIRELMELLSLQRFPLLEDRIRHLKELLDVRKVDRFIEAVIRKDDDIVENMVRRFPGFGSDIFLKRLSLFFIQLYRKYGWYVWEGDLMSRLPVPADYQVPKILNHFGCIQYTPSLEEDIYEGKLIPKNSLEEIQIRAATIKICEKMRKELDWPIGDVDTYLWTKRKLSDIPFHCTYTTDY